MVLVYKCPSCGSNMTFDSENQKLVCSHCNTVKNVDEVKADSEEEQMDVKSYKCPTCGAELLADLHTTATFCNYCGNSALIETRIKQDKPSKVIPFTISKEKAVEAYLKWCKKGILTPKSFVEKNTLEKISGIYVPFWLYDYDTEVTLRADCTRVRVERRGDTEYTHTDHFDVFRDVRIDYNKIPVDASEKMPDEIMDKLEPFDYSGLKSFDMPYLSGFLSEKYNFTDDELRGRAENRVRSYASNQARGTINGYATTIVIDEQITLNKKDTQYVLLPVWILNYRYLGKDYMFAMNGQTGKVVGDLPVSKSKAAGWFASVAAASFIIIHILSILLF